MKKIALLLIMIIPVFGISQTSDWELYKDQNGVLIYSMEKDWNDPSEGINQEMVLLKFVNSTDQELTIEWFDVRWYGGDCVNCDNYQDPEYKHSITLAPGESLEGTCSFDSPSGLSIFKRFVHHKDVKALTNFELRDLQINPV